MEEGEGVAFGIADGGTGIADGEHCLFLGEGFGGVFPGGDGGGGRVPFFPGGEVFKMAFEEIDEGGWIEIACDGEGEVCGAEVAGVVGGEVEALEFAQRFHGSEGVEGVALAGVVGAAELLEAAMQGIGEGFLKGGELAGFFPLNRIGGEDGIEDDIGEDIEDGKDIRGEAGGLDEQGVVASGGADVRAESLESGGDLLSVAAGGALGEGGGEELVEAVVLGCFRGQPGAGGGLEMDERDTMVRQQGELEAVGEGVGGDAFHDGGGFLLGDDGHEVFRIE